jgi:hypothetical protein
VDGRGSATPEARLGCDPSCRVQAEYGHERNTRHIYKETDRCSIRPSPDGSRNRLLRGCFRSHLDWRRRT